MHMWIRTLLPLLTFQLVLWLQDWKITGTIRFILWNRVDDNKHLDSQLFKNKEKTLTILSDSTLSFLVLLHFQRKHITDTAYDNDNLFFHYLTPQQFNFIRYKLSKFKLWERFGSAGGLLTIILFLVKNFTTLLNEFSLLKHPIILSIVAFITILLLAIFYYTRRINYVLHQLKQVSKERDDIK